jgi:hypothetical protein
MEIDLAALGSRATGYTEAIVLAGLAVALGWLIHAVAHRVLVRLSRASAIAADEVLVRCLRHPARWALIAMAFALASRRCWAGLRFHWSARVRCCLKAAAWQAAIR